MANIRKFYLENAATGERYGLQGERGVYLTLPEGLGYELSPTWADLRHGFFISLDPNAEPQGTVAGTLVFVHPAYANYRTFVDWVAAAGTGLRLVYSPTADVEVWRLVSVQVLSKGELTKTRLLEVPCSFFCLSPWHRPVPTEMALDAGDDSSRQRRYSYRYTSTLRYGSDAAGLMSARIKAMGHIPGAVVLRYSGAITAPRVRLTGADSGTVYGILDLSAASLGASEAFELSTLWEDSYVAKIAADGSRSSLLPYVDLSYDPYFHTPVDEDAILTIESALPFSGAASLLVYGYYRTV